ncbi:hypothetical protein [Clostridium kluyveri]|uniref:DUF4834 domain-containing protein n=1 Tax=Clostridium kluyveri TaxID=1534 RepID=A0A1L5F9B6_CLOKL|nr:hypothetical protein [Clostridium kluyveri]APM39618.1 hypothetical protein BS101_13150 [Clostridium kluyveri]UZQ50228.1 hypothetical protein OP486_20180 [Clostridium kluyveri]
MDFVGKNFAVVWKIILALIVLVVFIRIVPLLAVAGVLLFLILKVKRYFKDKKNYVFKSQDKQNIKKDKEEPFDFSHKKIIDVDYYEVKKSSKS